MATNWINRACKEIPQAPRSLPVKTAETQAVSVLAVTDIEDVEKNKWLNHWHDYKRIIMEKRGFNEATAAIEASDWVLVEFQNQTHQDQPDMSACGHCGQHCTDSVSNPGFPLLNGGGGHIWVHRGCYQDWLAAGEAKAKAALQAYGIIFND